MSIYFDHFLSLSSQALSAYPIHVQAVINKGVNAQDISPLES